MGDIADLMISGGMCSTCGEVFSESVGYPRMCHSCGGARVKPKKQKQATGALTSKNQFKCECGKRFATEQGLGDHKRDSHK